MEAEMKMVSWAGEAGRGMGVPDLREVRRDEAYWSGITSKRLR